MKLEDKSISPEKNIYFDETTFPHCPALNKSHVPLQVNKLPSFTGEDVLPYANHKLPEEELEEEVAEEERNMEEILNRLQSQSPQQAKQAQESQVKPPPGGTYSGGRFAWTLEPPEKEVRGDIDSSNILTEKRRHQAFLVAVASEPKNHKQAMSGPKAMQWREAELKEFANMNQHHVWDIQ